MPDRKLTDADILALKEVLEHHTCHQFSSEQVDALRALAEEIKDPKVRRALVSAGEIWRDSSSMIRKGILTLVFLGMLALAFLGGWFNFTKGG